MKASFEKISLSPDQSFRADEWSLPAFNSPWHFHPEIELTYIISSTGQRMVGDSLEPFSPGELVLIGPNLPHVWQNLMEPHQEVLASSVVIQFQVATFGSDFFRLPELAHVDSLLQRSARGVLFTPSLTKRVEPSIRKLPHLNGLTALRRLLEILDILSQNAADARPLCTLTYAPRLDNRASERITKVITYILDHVADPIHLSDLSTVAAMSPSAFSRYFKRATGRNPSHYINDLRIEQSATWLRETDEPITFIAEKVGFLTLTSFNRRFKERMHITPREYRKRFH